MYPISPHDACPFEPELKALLDNELAPSERHKVERHLAGCASCTEMHRFLRQLTEEVHAMPERVSCPESVTDRVLGALPAQAPARLRFFEFSIVRWLAAGGMAAVMVAIIMPIFSQARLAARRPSSTMASPVPASDAIARPYAPSAGGMEMAKQGAPPAGVAGEAGGGMGGPAASAPMAQAQVDLERPMRSRTASKAPGGGAGIPAEGYKANTATDDVSKYAHGKVIDEVMRKVAKSATLGVEVNERLETLQDRIAKKVAVDEGYVESMKLDSPAQGKRTSRMALRVPVNVFEGTIEYLSRLGEVTTKEMGGKDITGTWMDQRADVRKLRKKEDKYAAAYRSAKTRADRERARKQLLELRPALLEADETFAATTKLAALARIDLTLTEEPQARIRGDLGRDMQNQMKAASAAFLSTLRVPATLLIWLAIFTPLWLPCLIAYRWATRMARRQQVSPVDSL